MILRDKHFYTQFGFYKSKNCSELNLKCLNLHVTEQVFN